jgi:amino acid transporter
MISILPFSGGSYAFARVTVGPYIGFLVGCFECLGNMIYSMIGMIPLGSYITYMIGGNKRWEPLYWLAIYVVMLLNEFSGRRRYFDLMRVVAFLLVMTLVFYIIISIPNSNSKKYLPEDSIDLMFQGGATEFLTAFPFSSFFFFGMEIIPLISDEVKDTRKHTPAAIVSTIFFVSIFSSLLLFFVYSQYPSYPRGDQKFSQNHLLALNTGFVNGFGVSNRVATLFSYPALVISNCICIYGFAKQTKALSDSRLFPSVLGKTFSGTKIPYNSLLLGCTLSYLILLIALAYDQVDVYSPIIFNTYCFGLLGTYFAYIILFISYMIFKRKYSTLPRVYVNRLGLGSAIYGIILLIVQFMIVCFSSSSFTSLQIFILFVFFLSLYYYFYARYRQTFSEEEQKILFVVYLLKGKFSSLNCFSRFSYFFFFFFYQRMKKRKEVSCFLLCGISLLD